MLEQVEPEPWVPVTPYDWETRREVERPNAERIVEHLLRPGEDVIVGARVKALFA